MPPQKFIDFKEHDLHYMILLGEYIPYQSIFWHSFLVHSGNIHMVQHSLPGTGKTQKNKLSIINFVFIRFLSLGLIRIASDKIEYFFNQFASNKIEKKYRIDSYQVSRH